jgi:hypothetical protein
MAFVNAGEQDGVDEEGNAQIDDPRYDGRYRYARKIHGSSFGRTGQERHYTPGGVEDVQACTRFKEFR